MYAVYVGSQPDGRGGRFDLFDVVSEKSDKYQNVLHGSTVGIRTINRLGIKKVLDKSGNPVRLGEGTKGGCRP